MSLPRIRVEVGFTSPYVGNFFTIGDPIRGQIGSVPIGPDDIWSDISPWVRSWSTRRGASQGNTLTRRYDPATAAIVLNDGDRRFDPDNLAGQYVSNGASQVEPMRRVRIIAEWNGVAYPLFSGFADDWEPDYQGSTWTYTTLTATDATKVFAAADRVTSVTQGTGDLAGARIDRILDAFGWPTEDRLVDDGDATLQSTTLSGNALAELQLVQDTELGELFFDAMGRAVFQGRASVLTRPESVTSQATFGDGGYVVAGELPYADMKLSTHDEDMANSITIGRVGGTPQSVSDSGSIGAHLLKGFERTDLLMQTDSAALDYASVLLYQHANPVRRVARLEFRRPALEVEDAVWPQLLGREFGDRITAIRRPAGGGDPIQRDVFVRGVEHQSDGQQWDSAFVLQAADRYSFFTIEHPNLGRIGVYPIAF